jgi:hypothetical protein
MRLWSGDVRRKYKQFEFLENRERTHPSLVQLMLIIERLFMTSPISYFKIWNSDNQPLIYSPGKALPYALTEAKTQKNASMGDFDSIAYPRWRRIKSPFSTKCYLQGVERG